MPMVPSCKIIPDEQHMICRTGHILKYPKNTAVILNKSTAQRKITWVGRSAITFCVINNECYTYHKPSAFSPQKKQNTELFAQLAIPLITVGNSIFLSINRPVSQMQALLAACRELSLDYNTVPKLQYVFEHKTCVLIHAPYTHIVVFWHISNIPQWFRRVTFVVMLPRFV